MSSHSLLDRIAGWPWAETATIVFGFAWGAMLGSFLNVVAHRLPRGESVVRHRSRCPACGAAIRPGDNVPVIGWLRLGGRCRDCHEPIAPRYPLVEAGCGLLVMVLAWAELVGGGRWLPRLGDTFPVGIDRLLRGDWSLLATCGMHAAVVLTIVTWSLLDLEGARPGRLLATLPIVLVTAFIAAVPASGPGGLLATSDWPPDWPRLQVVLASLAGAAVGWGLGLPSAAPAVRLGLPLLGSVLGWQAVMVVAVATVAITHAAQAVSVGRRPAAGFVLAAAGTLGIAFQAPLRVAVGAALRPLLGP